MTCSRQLDAVMYSESIIDWYVQAFMKGNYAFERTAQAGPSALVARSRVPVRHRQKDLPHCDQSGKYPIYRRTAMRRGKEPIDDPARFEPKLVLASKTQRAVLDQIKKYLVFTEGSACRDNPTGP